MHCFQKCGQEARFISLTFDAQQIVQLLYFSSTLIHHLSGGLEVCLNIVLAMNPTILLTNEHFFSLEIQTRRLYNYSYIQGVILFVTYSVDEAVVLGDMMGTLTTKFDGMRKECVNLLRSSDHSMTSKTRLTTQESGELYFDDEIGEDSKIGITKVFH
jgi:ABC-type nitrate/sulfonate/bicarbonate transport system ATPase subunit